jgi:hypothetical protein
MIASAIPFGKCNTSVANLLHLVPYSFRYKISNSWNIFQLNEIYIYTRLGYNSTSTNLIPVHSCPMISCFSFSET